MKALGGGIAVQHRMAFQGEYFVDRYATRVASYNPFFSLYWMSTGKTLADLAVLTADYFSVEDEEIKSLESVLTILGGKPVYARDEFKPLDPGDLPVMDARPA